MSDSSIPRIFLKNPRTNAYLNLSAHQFELKESNFILAILDGKMRFLPRNPKGKLKVADVSRMFSINANTIRSWRTRDVNKKKGRTEKRGRPPTFDETAEEELVNDVKKRRKERDTVFGFELMVMMGDKKKETEERRGKSDTSTTAAIVCESTAMKYKEDLDISTVHAQSLTDARLLALSSIRVIYRWACLIYEQPCRQRISIMPMRPPFSLIQTILELKFAL